MSRFFMLQTWVGSHENEPDYNGQQCGERNVRSIEAVPLYDQFGNANVSAFSDEAIASRSNVKKASTISIKDKILPQKRRVDSLTAQMVELESEYKAGKLSIQDYSLYRDIVSAKRDRAIVLLNRAMKVKPIRPETDEDSVEYTPSSGFSPQPDDGYASEGYQAVGVIWVDELSDGNSFKKILQRGCKGVRTLVRWHQALRNYYLTLKEL